MWQIYTRCLAPSSIAHWPCALIQSWFYTAGMLVKGLGFGVTRSWLRGDFSFYRTGRRTSTAQTKTPCLSLAWWSHGSTVIPTDCTDDSVFPGSKFQRTCPFIAFACLLPGFPAQIETVCLCFGLPTNTILSYPTTCSDNPFYLRSKFRLGCPFFAIDCFLPSFPCQIETWCLCSGFHSRAKP